MHGRCCWYCIKLKLHRRCILQLRLQRPSWLNQQSLEAAMCTQADHSGLVCFKLPPRELVAAPDFDILKDEFDVNSSNSFFRMSKSFCAYARSRICKAPC